MGQKKQLSRKPEPERRIRWPRWTGFRGKTVWDWMDLLIVPFALVVIGLLFSMLQETSAALSQIGQKAVAVLDASLETEDANLNLRGARAALDFTIRMAELERRIVEQEDILERLEVLEEERKYGHGY